MRDPVHGLVDFEGRAEKTVESLLATREVQRLRRVRQLGLTSLVFPGAEHTRFSHAVGAAHIMVRLQARLQSIQEVLPVELRIDEESEQDAIAAALLHDLGHGPFSHLFEQVMPASRHHEQWTHDAIVDPSTDVHKALERLSQGMAHRVSALLSGTHRLTYLSSMVSGVWDVDRADYLLRDSHMTGVRYGLYDLDWLLRSFCFAEVTPGEWVVAIEGRKGLPPIEGFFLARHYMYQQVYHHKATRAAETLIRGLLARLAERVREGQVPEDTPPALIAAAEGKPFSLTSYLELDDSALLSAVAAWSKGDDAILARLSSNLLARRLPKTIPLPEDDEDLWHLAHARAAEIAKDAGFRPDLTVRLDVARDVPFAEPDSGGLYVQIRHQPLRKLGDTSFLLQHLRGKEVRSPRLIFPAELRQHIRQAVGELMGQSE